MIPRPMGKRLFLATSYILYLARQISIIKPLPQVAQYSFIPYDSSSALAPHTIKKNNDKMKYIHLGPVFIFSSFRLKVKFLRSNAHS